MNRVIKKKSQEDLVIEEVAEVLTDLCTKNNCVIGVWLTQNQLIDALKILANNPTLEKIFYMPQIEFQPAEEPVEKTIEESIEENPEPETEEEHKIETVSGGEF